jgi:hypothetical protein
MRTSVIFVAVLLTASAFRCWARPAWASSALKRSMCSNRTNFNQPNTGITNSAFGTLTGTDGNPRILPLAIKIVF